MDKFAAVTWIEEKSFSAIQLKQIKICEPEGWTSSMIIGLQFDAEARPGEYHKCEIIAIGTRKKMEKLVLDKALEAADCSFMEKDEEFFAEEKKTRKQRAKLQSKPESRGYGGQSSKRLKLLEKDDNRERNSEDIVGQMRTPPSTIFSAEDVARAGASESDGIENFDPVIMGTLNETDDNDEVDGNTNDDMRKLKRRLRNALRQNKLLEEKVRILENPSIVPEPQRIVIGDGITAQKSVVDDIIMDFARNPSKFLRQLMLRTGIFTLAEIASSSVKGHRSRDGQRPALDVHRFAALKSFTIQTCGLRDNTVEMLKFERSMISICSDARKMLKSKAPSEIL